MLCPMSEITERLKAALADRYAIERELGAGGMATVYLAEDLKLHRKVAVKVLRPDLAAILGPERFLQEIDIAAQLTHPHILGLYDCGEADGFLYYVMPYVEGESLRDKLAREGELPVADAVRILREVVDALAKAHSNNVVHRDIKPDNVMLSDRHALVMDFGVAKAVSEATGRNKMTTAGVALGTPAYMAPEQVAADPHIDHRADIYAVGAMAYEMLTGRPPFTGATQQEILAAHVTQAAEPVTRYRSSVPPGLAQLVMKCLEKKAADRWQTAEELLPQLEALSTPSGGMAPTEKRPRKRILAISVALTAAVAVAAFAAARFVTVGGAGTLIGENVLAEHDLILVSEFQNRTDDASLAATVTDAMRLELQQSRVVEVLGQQAMWDGMRRMGLELGEELADNLVRELAERESVKAYVTGDVSRLGSGYQLAARVVSTADGTEALTVRTTARDDTHLIDAVEKLGKQLRRDIGESLRSVRAAPPLARVTTASLPALRALTAARRAERDGDRRRAIALAEEAVALDTAFAMAWYALYVYHTSSNRYGPASEGLERAYAFGDRLSERERLTVTASYHGQNHEYALAEAAHLQRIELDPESGAGLVSYADHLLSTGRWAEAESLSLRAAELRPRNQVAYWNAVEAQVTQRRFRAADSTLRVMVGNLPDHSWWGALTLSVSFAQREFDSTRALLDSLETAGVPGWFPSYARARCWLSLYSGRLRGGERCGPADINTTLAELRYGGDTTRVRDLVDSLLAVENPPGSSYPMLISVLAEMGRLPEAHRVLTEWEERFGPDDLQYRTDVGAAAGSIAIAEGFPDSAVTAFLAWNRSGFLTSTHVYNRGLAEAANAHDRAGRPDSAIALYERALATPSVYGALYEVTWYPHAIRRLGELHESLGHRDPAIDYYERFIELWKDADPELQPQVQAVRERLASLVGEPRR